LHRKHKASEVRKRSNSGLPFEATMHDRLNILNFLSTASQMHLLPVVQVYTRTKYSKNGNSAEKKEAPHNVSGYKHLGRRWQQRDEPVDADSFRKPLHKASECATKRSSVIANLK
jgi:hypothetical protein